MKSLRGWTNVESGDVTFWNCNKPVKIACCGCGLVHKFVITKKFKRGFLKVQIFGDARATARIRAKK